LLECTCLVLLLGFELVQQVADLGAADDQPFLGLGGLEIVDLSLDAMGIHVAFLLGEALLYFLEVDDLR
jgi:hypothetical protein